MASKSRWAAPDPEEEAFAARKRQEKEAKKRAKEARQRAAEAQQREAAEKKEATASADAKRAGSDAATDDGDEAKRAAKRQRLSHEPAESAVEKKQAEIPEPPTLLRFPTPEWRPCRHVDNFENLNRIEEGSYGFVSRAKDKNTGEIVALKKLKMDNPGDGFPITGLREIQTLMESKHENILHLREVVMGDTLDDVILVMDFIEHDLKTLLDDMQDPFLPSETKTILRQLIAGTEFLHSHWIMHRDLKTSNILMSNRGEIKIADFGMARYYGDPPPQLTRLVVTLWYRAPELLLGTEEYGPEIDMWSIGCIFGELLLKEPLLQAKNEVEQLAKIFDLTGPPTSQTWPGWRSLPNAKSLRLPNAPKPPAESKGPITPLLPRTKFPSYLTNAGLSLLSNLLALHPGSRPTAAEALNDGYFREDPKPKAKAMFPTFPSKAGLEKRRRRATPEAPKHGEEVPHLDFASAFGGGMSSGSQGAGFSLRFG